MIKQQFMKNKLLIVGIVAFVIAIGIISVYGYTQYGPKQITVSSLDASTGKMDTKTITASNADTVEKVLRNNQIPIDSINYSCSENLNSNVKNISQIHIEKKATSQSKTTNDNNANNQALNTQNASSTQVSPSVTNVSSSGSATDGKSKTPSSTAVQPVVVPVNTDSKTQEPNPNSTAVQNSVTTLSDNVPTEENKVSPVEQVKQETTNVKPDSETVVGVSESPQDQSVQTSADSTKADSSKDDVDSAKASSLSSDVDNIKVLSDSNGNDKVASQGTENKTEQSVKTETIEMDIPFGTKRVNSDQVKKGEEVVTTLGVNGLKNVTCEVTYVDNKVVSRKTISEEIITQPITEVISVGTGAETTLQPATNSSSNQDTSNQDTSNQEKTEEAPNDNPEQKDILDYLSEYALSINMSNGGTYGNATQSTSSVNMDFVCAVVAQEGGTSYEGALAVISCIMNRADSGAWGDTNVEGIIKMPGQFEAYESGAYEKYLGQSLPEVEAAVRDCMDCGLRTHPYQSFRSYQSDGSVTNIGGNWYF